MRSRGLWDRYVEGVISFANGHGPDTGLRTGPEDLEQALHQGYADARDKRVLGRTEFTREKLLRRAEVREHAEAVERREPRR